jgi:hypothetical protein
MGDFLSWYCGEVSRNASYAEQCSRRKLSGRCGSCVMLMDGIFDGGGKGI